MPTAAHCYTYLLYSSDACYCAHHKLIEMSHISYNAIESDNRLETFVMVPNIQVGIVEENRIVHTGLPHLSNCLTNDVLLQFFRVSSRLKFFQHSLFIIVDGARKNTNSII